MARTVVEVTGTPQLVDTFLAPVARVLALGIGGVISVGFWWFALVWWVPLPLAFAVLSTELWLARRADRAQTVRLEGTLLSMRDPLAAAPRAVELSTVTNATLFYRAPQELLGIQSRPIDIVVGNDEDVQFALRLTVGGPFEPRIHDVPVDPIDRLLGGIAGVYRALAPAMQRPRQPFVDPQGAFLRALLAAIPPDAWRRTGFRTWTGLEPGLDLFGYYEAAHDGWVVLEDHQWRYGAREGSIEGWGLHRAERSAVLFQGLEDRQTVERVALGIVDLGVSLTVAVPMPLLQHPADVQPLSGDLRHTHAPEGAALLWHLLLNTPRDRWPEALRAQLRSADEGGAIASMLPGG